MILGGLLLGSAFFSLAETSMIALNRYRLRILIKQERPGAVAANALLGTTDQLLSLLLIGNNLLNAGISAMVTAIAVQTFGNHESVLAISTGVVAFLIIVFAEITPKIIGASYPEKIALPISLVLKPLLSLSRPLVWFVNLFTGALLSLFRTPHGVASPAAHLGLDELKAIVLESSPFIPSKHRSILINLFELEQLHVSDIMTPRNHIEMIDLSWDTQTIAHQISQCRHTRIVVCEEHISKTKGILHIRRAASLLLEGHIDRLSIIDCMTEPYYVPAETPVFKQLQFFQERRERIALVVDEYGDIKGLVTLEDILEEIIGEFTTSAYGQSPSKWKLDTKQQVSVEGNASLRDLNRHLQLNLPLGEARTLNGLILEHLEYIPKVGVSLQIENCVIEVIETEGNTVKSARLTLLPTNISTPTSSSL